ncbi:hypothetical protein E4U41_002906 [Claviceps citrina]|nr:hypothetical protein E4U41_002906 [Claviceps citrina]
MKFGPRFQSQYCDAPKKVESGEGSRIVKTCDLLKLYSQQSGRKMECGFEATAVIEILLEQDSSSTKLDNGIATSDLRQCGGGTIWSSVAGGGIHIEQDSEAVQRCFSSLGRKASFQTYKFHLPESQATRIYLRSSFKPGIAHGV